MGRSSKLAIALTLLTTLAVFCLASCGEDSTDPSSSSTGGDGASATAPATDGSEPSTDSSADGDSGDDGEGLPADPRDEDNPSRGAVSPRSAGFQGHNGALKRVPEFGEEASGSERNEAQAVLKDYLRAVGADEWERACSYTAAELLAQIDEIVATAKRPVGDSCGEKLRFYTETAVQPSTKFQDYDTATVTSFRVKDDAGFALIHGSDGEDYWAAMKLQGGTWKVLTLVPQQLSV
jgi:hypothetical protein